MANVKQFGGLDEGAGQQHEQRGTPMAAKDESGTGVLQKAGDAARDIQAAATRQVERARRVAEEQTEEVVRFLKARPVESVLIGVAVGYLLGWLASKAVAQRRTAHRRRAVYEL